MGDLTVRPLTRDDRDAVRAMLAGSGVFSDAGFTGEYSLLAAAQDGRVCGYACFSLAPLTDSSWYLYWICIARDGRRPVPSVGGERRRPRPGRVSLVLETSSRPGYGRARRFCRRAGFVEVGCIPDPSRPGDDCLTYCRVLAGK